MSNNYIAKVVAFKLYSGLTDYEQETLQETAATAGHDIVFGDDFVAQYHDIEEYEKMSGFHHMPTDEEMLASLTEACAAADIPADAADPKLFLDGYYDGSDLNVINSNWRNF